MIQDIFPKVYHNEYQDLAPDENDFILIFHKNTVLVRFQDEKLRYPALKELAGFSLSYHYLFSIDDYKYFLAYFGDDCNANAEAHACYDMPVISIEGYSYENVTIFRTADSKHTAFAGDLIRFSYKPMQVYISL